MDGTIKTATQQSSVSASFSAPGRSSGLISLNQPVGRTSIIGKFCILILFLYYLHSTFITVIFYVFISFRMLGWIFLLTEVIFAFKIHIACVRLMVRKRILLLTVQALRLIQTMTSVDQTCININRYNTAAAAAAK